MKATLKVNDKEIEVEITEEELKKLEKTEEKKHKILRGNSYHFLDSYGKVVNRLDTKNEIDNYLYSIGNYFKTPEEAEFHKNELIYTQMLKDYICEHDDVLVDWEDRQNPKYAIYYDFINKKIKFVAEWYCKYQGAIHASNKQVLEDVVKFIGEDNVKKYILKVEEQEW